MRACILAIILLAAARSSAEPLAVDLASVAPSPSLGDRLIEQRGHTKKAAGAVLIPAGAVLSFAGLVVTGVGAMQICFNAGPYGAGCSDQRPDWISAGVATLVVGAVSVAVGAALWSSGKADLRRARAPRVAFVPSGLALRF